GCGRSRRSRGPAPGRGSRASRRARARRAATRTPSPTPRLPRRPPSCSPDEVDRHGHALELEALPELVLDPVAVVAGHETRIVHEEAETRRPLLHLRAVEEVQAPAVARRRLARLAQLGEEAVQLAGADARHMLLELLLDPVEQARDAAAGLGAHGHHRAPRG